MYDELVIDPGVDDKRLLLVETEFAAVLAKLQHSGANLSPTLRDACDGRTLRSLTKHTSVKATGAQISIIGHITDDELRRRLTTSAEALQLLAERDLAACDQQPTGGRPATVWRATTPG
jgi:hypothetical protein